MISLCRGLVNHAVAMALTVLSKQYMPYVDLVIYVHRLAGLVTLIDGQACLIPSRGGLLN